jgi:hypothetical protein
LALQGATNLLKCVEAINTAVNYEELYEGGALMTKLTNFWRITVSIVLQQQPRFTRLGGMRFMSKSQPLLCRNLTSIDLATRYLSTLF